MFQACLYLISKFVSYDYVDFHSWDIDKQKLAMFLFVFLSYIV